MSFTRLSSTAALPLGNGTQLDKVSSATPGTPLPFAATPNAPLPVNVVTLDQPNTIGPNHAGMITVTYTAHGLANGDLITLSGLAVAAYNATYPVTLVDANNFTVSPSAAAISPVNPPLGADLTTIRYFGKNSTAFGTPVVSITQTGGVATVTTSAAHGLSVGDGVNVKGAMPSDYKGLHTVATVPLTTTFTYAVPSGIASPATPERKLIVASVPAQKATRVLIRAAVGNTDSISFGPTKFANFDTILAGGTYLLEGDGATLDLSTWFFQSATASQSVSLLYV